jgi:hypothetical protein
MTLQSNADRRRDARHILVRACKVRGRRDLLFSAGQTHDVSDSGALVRVERTRQFGPGDELDIVVAWSDEPLLSADATVRARVRRVTPIDHHHQAIALEFIETSAVAIAA